MDMDGGNLQRLTQGKEDVTPAISPDGQWVVFSRQEGGNSGNVWEQPIAGGPPKAVTHFTSDRIFWYDWSRDGRLAFSRGTKQTDAVLIKNFQ